MRLSGAVEQACCIMAILADPKRTTPVTNDALAEKMMVSPTYLKKISRKLVIAKLFSEAQEKWSEYLKTVTLEDVAKEVAHD